MRRNLGVGMQGKAVDTGTRGPLSSGRSPS
jgi:hypothetical protein